MDLSNLPSSPDAMDISNQVHAMVDNSLKTARKSIVLFAVGFVAIIAIVGVFLYYLSTQTIPLDANTGLSPELSHIILLFVSAIVGVVVLLSVAAHLLVKKSVKSMLSPAALLSHINQSMTNPGQMLQNGEHASATILSVEDTGISIGNQCVLKLKVQVHSSYSGELTSTVQSIFPRTMIPRSGDAIEVVFDPHNPNVVMVIPKAS